MLQKENFTKSLAREVSVCKTIDIHSHIDIKNPTAKNLWEVISYHYILTELRSAGLPRELLKEKDTPQDRVCKVIPFLPKIKNTVMAKILMRILRDLYGMKEDFLSKKNWERIDEKIQKKSKDPLWHQKILRGYAKVEKVFLAGYEPQAKDTEIFQSVLRLDHYFFEKRNKNLDQLISELLLNYKKESYPEVKNLSIGLPVDCEYEVIKNKSFLPTKPSEKINLVLTALCELAKKNGHTFQLLIGVKHIQGISVPFYNPCFLSGLTSYFSAYPEVRFDLSAAHINYHQEMTVLAKFYQNVSLSGCWWYAFYPNYIERVLRERLEMLPLCKIGGFFSDAYQSEWCFGKLKMAQDVTLKVLSGMVSEKRLTEKEAVEAYYALFYLNPKRYYLVNN